MLSPYFLGKFNPVFLLYFCPVANHSAFHIIVIIDNTGDQRLCFFGLIDLVNLNGAVAIFQRDIFSQHIRDELVGKGEFFHTEI